MTDDSLHNQPAQRPVARENAADPAIEAGAAAAPKYPTLADVTAGEVRPVPRRRFSLNGILLLLVVVVWSVAIGFFLSTFPLLPPGPQVPSPPPAAIHMPMPDRPAPPVTEKTAATRAPERQEEPVVVAAAPPDAEQAAVVPPAVVAPLYRVTIGPFIDSHARQQATDYLQQHALAPRSLKGTGPVRMIRLFAGSYSVTEAEEQLRRMQAVVPSAFTMPENGRRALYAASFQSPERALALQKTLADAGMTVTQKTVEMTLSGTLLLIEPLDQERAEQLKRHFEASGTGVRSEALELRGKKSD